MRRGRGCVAGTWTRLLHTYCLTLSSVTLQEAEAGTHREHTRTYSPTVAHRKPHWPASSGNHSEGQFCFSSTWLLDIFHKFSSIKMPRETFYHKKCTVNTSLQTHFKETRESRENTPNRIAVAIKSEGAAIITAFMHADIYCAKGALSSPHLPPLPPWLGLVNFIRSNILPLIGWCWCKSSGVSALLSCWAPLFH